MREELDVRKWKKLLISPRCGSQFLFSKLNELQHVVNLRNINLSDIYRPLNLPRVLSFHLPLHMSYDEGESQISCTRVRCTMHDIHRFCASQVCLLMRRSCHRCIAHGSKWSENFRVKHKKANSNRSELFYDEVVFHNAVCFRCHFPKAVIPSIRDIYLLSRLPHFIPDVTPAFPQRRYNPSSYPQLLKPKFQGAINLKITATATFRPSWNWRIHHQPK